MVKTIIENIMTSRPKKYCTTRKGEGNEKSFLSCEDLTWSKVGVNDPCIFRRFEIFFDVNLFLYSVMIAEIS